MLELLTQLVDKSLVVVTWRGEAVRYGMLETVWRYASEMLDEAGEAEDARRAHAEYFLRVAEEAEPGPDRRGSGRVDGATGGRSR